MTAPAERFNSELADAATGFISKHLTNVEGECIGQPVALLPWQSDTFRKVIGTQRFSEEQDRYVRRYKTVYVEIPRKNGKSLWLSTIAIYHLMSDPTLRGQDIVCVACDKAQAALVFDTAAEMIEANPALEKRCYIAKRSNKRIENLRNGNQLYVIPGDAEGALGLRPAVILFDELLAQKKRALYDMLTTGQGASRQPLLWMITTAGEYGTLCHERAEYGRAVLSGEVDDPSFLYVHFGIADGEDWTDRKVWRRCNPGLGVTVMLDYLETKFTEAMHSLEAQLTFRKYYLNEWNLSETSWLDMGAWDANGNEPIDIESLRGLPCWIGVDLSSRRDLTAAVALFKRHDGSYAVLCRFFLPEDGIDDKSRRDGAPYRGWSDNGFLTLTPGRTIDYGAVYEAIVELADIGDLQDIGYDEHNAGDLEAQLEKAGLPAFDVPQGFWLSESLKTLEAAMIDGRLDHGGHPVLKWCAQNAIVKVNEVSRIKLIKKLATKRIDGIAALGNAFDRMSREEEPSAPLAFDL